MAAFMNASPQTDKHSAAHRPLQANDQSNQSQVNPDPTILASDRVTARQPTPGPSNSTDPPRPSRALEHPPPMQGNSSQHRGFRHAVEALQTSIALGSGQASTTTPSGPSSSGRPRASKVMDRDISTVNDLWAEYDVGWRGEPSIRSREAEGTAWRRDPAESKFFRLRMTIIREVELRAAEDAVPGCVAAEELERIRVAAGTRLNSLDKLIKALKDQNVARREH